MRFLALLLAVCGWVQAGNIERTLATLAATRQYPETAISPDGTRVAWVEERDAPEVFVLDRKTAGAKPRRIGEGEKLAWSPDGKRLAFLSRKDSPGQAQLYVANAGGGAPRRLTNLKGYVTDPAWSPDGREIAVLFAENAPGGGGPLEAVPVETGVIGSAVYNQRIAVVEAESGAVRQVSPKGLHVYEYDWRPDGRGFAFTAAPGPGDNNWWIAKLYTMGVEGGEARAIFEPPARMQLAVPRWSPDGGAIAFIGGLMSDAGFTGGDVLVIPAGGGEARDVTPGRKASPSWVRWVARRKLLFTESVGGGSDIATLDLDSGRFETVWRGDFDVHSAGNYPNFSMARDGVTCALVRQSWSEPPEVWVGEIGKWRPVTSANATMKPAWGEAKSITWKSDGMDVQGWLLYPAAYDPARRYPLVVEVHGGPAGVKKPRWPSHFFDMSVLSGEGYFVLFPNPRGSYGQGEEFVQANVKDFGGGDLRDILAGVDRVAAMAPVDLYRVGITGWSYGGFMSMLSVTRTDRFRAAVAGAGIANWQSYYGENSIDRWMIPYFGATVYDDPAVYAKASAITAIKRVKTPTLVLVGERDGECPAPQSYEFWHALKTLGVETELVVYAGEGHSFRDLRNRVDAVRRTVGWFNAKLK